MCQSCATIPLAIALGGARLCAMENGHSYPSQCAWRFGKRTNPPATQHEVVDELRRRYASDWPTIWGTIWSHREACMVAVLRALDAALAEPKVTRQGLRRSLLAALAAIAARGPETIPPRSQCG